MPLRHRENLFLSVAGRKFLREGRTSLSEVSSHSAREEYPPFTIRRSVYTTVYAWELNSGMPTAGINLLWLLIAGDN